MKCQIPEISWHNRDPVLSIDVQPKNVVGRQRLASGGTDSHVLIWYISTDSSTGVTNFEIVSELNRHTKSVNVVRWAPNGELLASGDDESVILIWCMKNEQNAFTSNNKGAENKETWINLKVLRGHIEDVYDLSWAPNSIYLASASVDNTAIIWDVTKGKHSVILQESKGFIQGVTWDPKNRFLATLSTDRSFRVYNVVTHKLLAKSNKCLLPVPKTHPAYGETIKLYHDDTLPTFFRRCSFSPDGAFVVVPSGIIDDVKQHATYIYTRNNWRTPSIVLPSDQYSVAVRFCPVLFALNHRNNSVFALPYRMIFAVAMKSSVYLYDTQQRTPIAIISNIHYARLTDLTWSTDGRILIVSSTDGFCSVINFEEGELGIEYDSSKTNSIAAHHSVLHPNLMKNENMGPKIEVPIDKILSVDENFSSPKKNKPATPIAVRRKPRTSENSAIMQDKKLCYSESTQDIKLVVTCDEETEQLKTTIDSSNKTKTSSFNVDNNLTPNTCKRVQFRTISTPKSKKKLL